MKTKVKRKTFLGDTFEQLSDTGSSTVRQTAKAVKKTFDPLQALDQKNNEPVDKKTLENAKSEAQKKENHTPLNLEKLEEKYKMQDKQKEIDLKLHLFKLVKEGEQQAYDAKKKKEEERKKKEEEEEEQKKKRRREEEKKRQEETTLPKGKQRRSIFSPKKKAHLQHAEFKPNTGQG